MWVLIFLVATILSLIAWVYLNNKLQKGVYVLLAFLVISIIGLSASICYYIGTSNLPLWIKIYLLS